jgi:hypothetical protein
LKDKKVFKISPMECTLECMEKLKYYSSHVLIYYKNDDAAYILAMPSSKIGQCLSFLNCLQSFLISFTRRGQQINCRLLEPSLNPHFLLTPGRHSSLSRSSFKLLTKTLPVLYCLACEHTYLAPHARATTFACDIASSCVLC